VDDEAPVNEPERACALHGFAFDTEWDSGIPRPVIGGVLLYAGAELF
jgi:hypothetical protein